MCYVKLGIPRETVEFVGHANELAAGELIRRDVETSQMLTLGVDIRQNIINLENIK